MFNFYSRLCRGGIVIVGGRGGVDTANIIFVVVRPIRIVFVVVIIIIVLFFGVEIKGFNLLLGFLKVSWMSNDWRNDSFGG